MEVDKATTTRTNNSSIVRMSTQLKIDNATAIGIIISLWALNYELLEAACEYTSIR